MVVFEYAVLANIGNKSWDVWLVSDDWNFNRIVVARQFRRISSLHGQVCACDASRSDAHCCIHFCIMWLQCRCSRYSTGWLDDAVSVGAGNENTQSWFEYSLAAGHTYGHTSSISARSTVYCATMPCWMGQCSAYSECVSPQHSGDLMHMYSETNKQRVA